MEPRLGNRAETDGCGRGGGRREDAGGSGGRGASRNTYGGTQAGGQLRGGGPWGRGWAG